MMDISLLSRLLCLAGAWPEACAPARASREGSAPESSDKWMTTLLVFKDFILQKQLI